MMALLMEYKDKKKDKQRIDRELEDQITKSIHEDDEDDDPEMQYAIRQSQMQHEFDYYRDAYSRGRRGYYNEGGSSQPPPPQLNRSASVHGFLQPTSTPAARLRAREVELEKDCQKKKQLKLGTGWLKKAKKELTKAFGNWMLDTNQPFRSIESPFTNPLMEVIREHPNVRAPSAYDIAELLKGVKNVISRLERDVESQVRALQQIHVFRDQMDSFASASAQTGIKLMDPVQSRQSALSPPSSDNGGDSDGAGDGGHQYTRHSIGSHETPPNWTPNVEEFNTPYVQEHNFPTYERQRRRRESPIDPVDYNNASWPGFSTNVFPSESSGSNYYYGDMPYSFHNFQPPQPPDSHQPYGGYYGGQFDEGESHASLDDSFQIQNHGTINYGGVHIHQPTYYGGNSSQNEPSWMDIAGSHFFGDNERFRNTEDIHQAPRRSFWY
ncbi:DNA polymerase II large subunit [Bienertia sinuspersici]